MKSSMKKATFSLSFFYFFFFCSALIFTTFDGKADSIFTDNDNDNGGGDVVGYVYVVVVSSGLFVHVVVPLFVGLSLEQSTFPLLVFLSDLLCGLVGIIVGNAIASHFFGGIVEFM